MTSASRLARSAGTALLALMLALRLVGATGYMPGFEHGRLTIIVCPDADPDGPFAVAAPHHHHHHRGTTSHKHGSCPYAAASSLGAMGADFAPLLGALIFGAALLLLGGAFSFIERSRARERPPSRAPPLPA
jgi:hypothetical protein